TFKFMYPFAAALGVITFFSLDSFIAWTIAILISTGIVFLLPVFMIALVSLRIVSPDFWKRKWRVALVFLLAFCALITPDQTGFTMILLFVPLMALYWLGAILTSRRKKAAF
ncbi:MAG: twin-arginine translocase subunit TatC, partial [Candidatus Wolfebacteria bacterium]|nr:twin-arginine translocase subunit TatC [Candidatus Wolfebacteria bacterium]